MPSRPPRAKATNKQAQAAKNEWNTREESSPDGASRPRHPGTKRNGSDSNAQPSSRGH